MESPLDAFDEAKALKTQEWLEKKLELYEATIVRKVLKICQAEQCLMLIRKTSEDMSGKPIVNFHWFNATFPKFPMILKTGKIGKPNDLVPGRLMSSLKFIRTRLYKTYVELQEDQIDAGHSDAHLGLVFDLPGAGSCVLHTLSPNAGDGPYGHTADGYFVLQVPKDFVEDADECPFEVYYLEPLERLISRLHFRP